MQNKFSTFCDLFRNLTPEQENKIALVSGNQQFTYGELDHAINLCASSLIDLGVKKGDHVGLWSFNSANTLIAFYAIVRIGAVAVLGNYSMTYDEIKEMFEMTDISYLIYGITLATRKDDTLYAKLAGELNLKGLFDIRTTSISFKNTLNDSVTNIDEINKRASEDDPHRDAYVIFTTGTTSKPKAVLDHQIGVLEDADRYAGFRMPLMGDSVCVSLPLFHIFGLLMITSYLMTRKTIYFSEKVGSDSVIQTLSQTGCKDIATVTSVFLGVIAHPDFNKISSQVRLLTTAGGLLTPIQFMKLENAFPNAKLFNEYGQTESHGIISSCASDDPIEKRAFTIGKPYVRDEVKIYNPDKGEVLNGEVGEIILKGVTLLNGYYKLPQEKQAVDENGWLHTGDLGMFDEDGYIRLVGRQKDLIIKNGENIAPAEVERAVSELDEVNEVKVFGARHNIWGESVECCVVLNPGCTFDEDSAFKRLKAKIASSKIPSHIIPFDSFPIAANGKLDQRGLRIKLMNVLHEMNIAQDLAQGIVAFEISLKNTVYNIVPVSMTIRALAEILGFDQNTVEKIALAVEEFLNIRIVETSDDVGEIDIRCILNREWLTIEFKDKGENYVIEKNEDTSLCAKIILGVADNFCAITNSNAATVYHMEFLYPKEVDVQSFIVEHDRNRL